MIYTVWSIYIYIKRAIKRNQCSELMYTFFPMQKKLEGCQFRTYDVLQTLLISWIVDIYIKRRGAKKESFFSYLIYTIHDTRIDVIGHHPLSFHAMARNVGFVRCLSTGSVGLTNEHARKRVEGEREAIRALCSGSCVANPDQFHPALMIFNRNNASKRFNAGPSSSSSCFPRKSESSVLCVIYFRRSGPSTICRRRCK